MLLRQYSGEHFLADEYHGLSRDVLCRELSRILRSRTENAGVFYHIGKLRPSAYTDLRKKGFHLYISCGDNYIFVLLESYLIDKLDIFQSTYP
jgi:hypothetical protein